MAASKTIPGPAETGSETQRQPTIAVNFDGVLAEYDGWKGAKVLEELGRELLKLLQFLRMKGGRMLIYTTKPKKATTNYSNRHGWPTTKSTRIPRTGIAAA